MNIYIRPAAVLCMHTYLSDREALLDVLHRMDICVLTETRLDLSDLHDLLAPDFTGVNYIYA
jgi:hypothetical protein